MAVGNAVWGIDVGQCALKAIKLRSAGDGEVELLAFDIIEHPKILSQPDADPEELIRAALEKFLSRNDWQGDKFVVGIPGQQTFARFCKLPPVDAKKIPDIVKFEASQQIPFDMDEVVWDYQVFTSPDSPDVEVGIFAMKKDLIRKHIGYFSDANIAPLAVQTAPSALYNFVRFDLPDPAEGTAAVIVDIGAQNTDLVIAEKTGAWSRNIPLGGNNFTDALVKAFKLSFAKAESLKRTAATSKYARQIFQAMRPVFAELVAEIQRSIGFYTSTHRDIELKGVYGLGNAFRLPGLQKYLENNLTIPGGVTRIEKFAKVVPSATINAPQFTENVLSFGVSYGLALQGLGHAAIGASLLPPELARIALWNKKRPYFAATAACLAMAASFVWARQVMDSNALEGGSAERTQAQQIINEAQGLKKRFGEVQQNTGGKEEQIKKYMDLSKNESLVPRIVAMVHQALPAPAPEIQQAQTADQLKKVIESDKNRFGRESRRQLTIESFDVAFVPDIAAFDLASAAGKTSGASPSAMSGMRTPQVFDEIGRGGPPRGGYTPPQPQQQQQPSAGGAGGGFHVQIIGRMTYGGSKPEAQRFLENELGPRLKELGRQAAVGFYSLIDDDKDKSTLNDDAKNKWQLSVNPYYDLAGRGGGAMPWNPMTPQNVGGEVPEEFKDPITGEDMRGDWRFSVDFKIMLGEPPKTEENKGQG
jgi:type IV pilus assembly protein PilM